MPFAFPPRTLILPALLALAPAAVSAQTAAPSAAPTVAQATVPAARPEDVRSVEAILDALYDVISGDAGEARDWNRMRSLFHPAARLIPTRPTATGAEARVMTLEEWIRAVEGRFLQNGFHEREIGRRVERYGNVAHVFSAYETVHAHGEKPFMRGVNSIQLLRDGDRWWVVTVFWDAEREGNPVPADLIGKQ